MTTHDTTNVQRLGDFLLGKKLLSQEQLDLALTVQAKSGMRLGSILMNLGILSADALLEHLARQTAHPGLDLYRLNLSPEVLGLIPFEVMKRYQALPVVLGEKSVFVAMVDPNNGAAINEISRLTGKVVESIVVPEAQMKIALQYLEERGGRLDRPLSGLDLERMDRDRARNTYSLNLLNIFRLFVAEDASDLLLTTGVPPAVKKYDQLVRLALPDLTPENTRDIAYEIMTAEQKDELEHSHDVDFAYTIHGIGRFRVNVYLQRHSISLAVRKIPDAIPSWESLNLPEWLGAYALKRQGIILITGPSGQGKTTTLMSLVDRINAQRKCNIITIEDPIEYLHKHRMSNVNQREVGSDTVSFHHGLLQIFRQAPDVIVIGELRDVESIEIAIRGAETGHLVLTTFHSTSTTSAIERLIDFVPPPRQNQRRVQLADNLLLTLNLRLLPRHDGSGRIICIESLANTQRIRNMIREGKTHHIKTMMQQSSEDFTSMDVSLAKLVRNGLISQHEAYNYCEDPHFLESLLKSGPRTSSQGRS